jgi:hypothetical protein
MRWFDALNRVAFGELDTTEAYEVVDEARLIYRVFGPVIQHNEKLALDRIAAKVGDGETLTEDEATSVRSLGRWLDHFNRPPVKPDYQREG